jgi:RNA polymerase sigma-70 factor, ECF subfamily
MSTIAAAAASHAQRSMFHPLQPALARLAYKPAKPGSPTAAARITEAATLTIRRYGPAILQYLCIVVKDSDDADDAFSRFAEGVWASIAGFRGEGSLKSWSYRIAWHAALRVLQDPYRRRRDLLNTSEASRLAADVRSTTSAALETLAAQRIERLRKELKPDEQTLIILRFDRGLSWREVAAVLDEEGAPIDEAALRKRFERLKKRLRDLAVAEGIVQGG